MRRLVIICTRAASKGPNGEWDSTVLGGDSPGVRDSPSLEGLGVGVTKGVKPMGVRHPNAFYEPPRSLTRQDRQRLGGETGPGSDLLKVTQQVSGERGAEQRSPKCWSVAPPTGPHCRETALSLDRLSPACLIDLPFPPLCRYRS